MGYEIPAGDAEVASADGCYRLVTSRIIDGAAPGRACCFLLMRPGLIPDGRPERRCLDFARTWGCGRALFAYLFSRVVTDVAHLVADGDPVGQANDDWLAAAVRHAVGAGGPVVCAWGSGGSLLERDATILRLLHDQGAEPTCLGVDRHGFPLTPAKARGLPIPYDGRPEE